MMIPGGDCAIVVDHPQEDDEEKEGSKSKQKNRGRRSSSQRLITIRAGKV
jgi:hypothetical protein